MAAVYVIEAVLWLLMNVPSSILSVKASWQYSEEQSFPEDYRATLNERLLEMKGSLINVTSLFCNTIHILYPI